MPLKDGTIDHLQLHYLRLYAESHIRSNDASLPAPADIDVQLPDDVAAAAAEDKEAADEAAELAASLAISSPSFEITNPLYTYTAE